MGREGGIDQIHNEVNGLKHAPQGIYFRRNVIYATALNGAGELLDLLEAWSKS